MKGMDAKMKRILAVIFAASIVLSGCKAIQGEKNLYATPEDTVKQIESALNDMDEEALLNCFDKNVQKVLSGGSKVISSLTGVDTEGIFEIFAGLYGMSESEIRSAEYELAVTDVAYEGDKNCIAYIHGRAVNSSGESAEGDFELPLKLQKDEWKIKVTLKDLGLE